MKCCGHFSFDLLYKLKSKEFLDNVIINKHILCDKQNNINRIILYLSTDPFRQVCYSLNIYLKEIARI